MSSLTSQTKESDMLKALLEKWSIMDLDLTKLSDGAPSMVGSKSGIITMLKEYLQTKKIDTKELMQFHCIIHTYIKRFFVQNYWNLKCDKSYNTYCTLYKISVTNNSNNFSRILKGNMVISCFLTWLKKSKYFWWERKSTSPKSTTLIGCVT